MAPAPVTGGTDVRTLRTVAAMAVSALALTGIARAQQNAPQPPDTTAKPADKAVQTFDPPFFARFSPVTAEDMVRQLPGFTLDEGADLRGFGATAGNVLIDGQRPSSKTSLRTCWKIRYSSDSDTAAIMPDRR